MGVSGVVDPGVDDGSVGFFPLRARRAASAVRRAIVKGLTMVWAGVAAIWLVCSVWAYGLTFGDFEGTFPPLEGSSDEWNEEFSKRNQRMAFSVALFGPIGVLVALIMGRCKYGLKFRAFKRVEQCEKD